jgi:hypothetical protein
MLRLPKTQGKKVLNDMTLKYLHLHAIGGQSPKSLGC